MTARRKLPTTTQSTDAWGRGARTIFEMLRPSRERLTQLARDLLEAMTRSRAVTLLKDREVVRQAIAHALTDELKREEEREESVLKRLATTRGTPKKGTPEWEQLFRMWMEEEYLRDGLDS